MAMASNRQVLQRMEWDTCRCTTLILAQIMERVTSIRSPTTIQTVTAVDCRSLGESTVVTRMKKATNMREAAITVQSTVQSTNGSMSRTTIAERTDRLSTTDQSLTENLTTDRVLRSMTEAIAMALTGMRADMLTGKAIGTALTTRMVVADRLRVQ